MALITPEEMAASSGWGWPALSKRAHFFRGGMSLCRRWAYMGRLEQNDAKTPDDCAACRRMRDKEKKPGGEGTRRG